MKRKNNKHSSVLPTFDHNKIFCWDFCFVSFCFGRFCLCFHFIRGLIEISFIFDLSDCIMRTGLSRVELDIPVCVIKSFLPFWRIRLWNDSIALHYLLSLTFSSHSSASREVPWIISVSFLVPLRMICRHQISWRMWLQWSLKSSRVSIIVVKEACLPTLLFYSCFSGGKKARMGSNYITQNSSLLFLVHK